jgi:hypothetical protein
LDRRAFYEGRYRHLEVEAEGQHQAILILAKVDMLIIVHRKSQTNLELGHDRTVRKRPDYYSSIFVQKSFIDLRSVIMLLMEKEVERSPFLAQSK